jgi:cell wall-associated NlpC family hydrolase
MAFTPLSGGRYVGTPRPARRPYTRAALGPPSPPDVQDLRARLRAGTQPLTNPQGPSRPPDVPTTPQAPVAPPATQQVAQAANAAGAQADYLTAYLAGITDPQERAYVAAQIGPKIAALRAQQQSLTDQYAQEQAQIQSLTGAILGQLKSLAGSVGGPYAQVAGIQEGSGKAEAKGMGGVGKGENAAIQNVLGAIGAPGSQGSGLAKLEQQVFGGGGLVLQGTGGTIPAFATRGTGIGALAWAAAQPTLAADYATDTIRQIAAQQARDQAAITGQYGDIPGMVTSATQDWQSQQADLQKQREDRAMGLYNAGLFTQRQLAQALNLPNWHSYPDVPKSSGQAHLIRYTDPATGRTMLYNPDTGKALALPGQGVRPTRTTAPKPYQHVSVGGKLYTFDPNRGVYLDPATGRAVAPVAPAKAEKGAGPPKVNLPLSRALGAWVDASGAPIPGLADAPPPTKTSGLKPPAAKKPAPVYTAPRLVRGQWKTRGGATLRPAAAAYWEAVYEAGFTDGRGRILHPVPPGWKPGDPGYGGDGGGGGGLLGPKASAAAKTAASIGGTGLVSYAQQQLGQPYIWGGESRKEGGFDCSGLVDWALRQEGYKGPRVTTYSLAKMGESVKGQGLQVGDLIITHGGGHVVIYAGNGQVIAAPHRGANVQYQPVSRFAGDITDVRRLSQYPAANAPWDPNRARTPAGARQMAQAMALNQGWKGSEWAALLALWNSESGFDYQIHNRAGSGAVGIPQAMPSSHDLPPDFYSNPVTQIRWGLDYIRSTYDTPSRAWAFWRATVNRNANTAPPDLRAKARQWIELGYKGY